MVMPTILILIATLSLAGCATANGEATGPLEWADVLAGAIEFVKQVVSLASAAAVVTVLINIGKTLGIVKDGTAKTWSFILNMILMIALLVMKIFVPGAMVETADQTLTTISEVLLSVLAILGLMMPVSNKVYSAVKGVSVIGKSYELDKSSK